MVNSHSFDWFMLVISCGGRSCSIGFALAILLHTLNQCFFSFCRRYLEQESLEKKKTAFNWDSWRSFAVAVSTFYFFSSDTFLSRKYDWIYEYSITLIWITFLTETPMRFRLMLSSMSASTVTKWFSPLDEATVSRVVFVIVSGSDGRKCFWSQLNNSKAVRDRRYVSMGSW